MKHTSAVSGLDQTIEMDASEAIALIAKLAECVHLAVKPGISSYAQLDKLEVTLPNGAQQLGRLTVIVRPE